MSFSRFAPWMIGGAVIVLGAAGAFVFLEEDDPNPPAPEPIEISCETSGTLVFVDRSLHLAVQQTLQLEEDFSPIPCDMVEQLEVLDASGRAISSLAGIEHAAALQELDLSENGPLVDLSLLHELPNLRSLNLSDTTLSDLDPFFEALPARLTELYLANNGIRTVEWIEQLPELTLLSVSGNPIVDITPLLSHQPFADAGSLFLHKTSLDLSAESEQREAIETLKARTALLTWDELFLTAGVNNTATRRATLLPPGDAVIVAEPALSDLEADMGIVAVEFFEVTDQGVLSTLGMDQEAPYELPVSFEQEDEGNRFRYAAEARTRHGATYLLNANQYAEVTLTQPECRVDADCADADRCTQDRCVQSTCQNPAIPACEPSEISCADQIDNDGDGDPDCDDTECFDDPHCRPDPAPVVAEPVACNLTIHMGCSSDENDPTCSLAVGNGSCTATKVFCDDEGCRIPFSGGRAFDWRGCGLEAELLGMAPGSQKTLAGFQCAGLDLCRGILLCAQ